MGPQVHLIPDDTCWICHRHDGDPFQSEESRSTGEYGKIDVRYVAVRGHVNVPLCQFCVVLLTDGLEPADDGFQFRF